MSRPYSYDEWYGMVGSIGPLDAARMSAEDGQDFETFAEGYADAWPFADEAPVPDDLAGRMVATMQAAVDAEVDRLIALRDDLGLDFETLGPVDCVAVNWSDRGFYVGTSGIVGGWYPDVADAEAVLREWPAQIEEWRANRAEEDRLRAMEQAPEAGAAVEAE